MLCEYKKDVQESCGQEKKSCRGFAICGLYAKAPMQYSNICSIVMNCWCYSLVVGCLCAIATLLHQLICALHTLKADRIK